MRLNKRAGILVASCCTIFMLLRLLLRMYFIAVNANHMSCISTIAINVGFVDKEINYRKKFLV